MKLNSIMHRADRELGLMRELGLSSGEAAMILDLVIRGSLSEADFHPRSFRSLVHRGIVRPVVRSLGIHERWSDQAHLERMVLWYVWTGDASLLRWWSFRASHPTFTRFLHPQTCLAYRSIQSFLAHPTDPARLFIEQQCIDLESRLMVWLVLRHFHEFGEPMSLKTAISLSFPSDEVHASRAAAWRKPDHPAYSGPHLIAHVQYGQVGTLAPSLGFYNRIRPEGGAT